MPGIIYRALPVTSYDFSALPIGQASIFVVAKAVDVSNYREANLIVRLHQASVSGSPNVQVDAFPTAPTAEDPANDFYVNTAVMSTGAIALSSVPSLTLKTVASGTAFGEFLRIQVTATQGGSTGLFKVTMSIDINAKS